MAGAVVENLSNRKLLVLISFLMICLLVCFLLGGLVAPAPSNVQSVLATKCLDHKQDKTQTFYVRPNGGCDRIDELHGPDAIERHLTDKNVVFAFQLPLPRGKTDLDYSRWMQNLIGILQIDVTYFKEWEVMEPRVPVTIEARLSYRNKGDAPDDWKLYANSTESRTMDCSPPTKDGYLYNCSLLPLFELGALHHDFYLLNIRFPVIYENNRGLGPIADVWLIAINQNGGFTKVWLSLKTFFFPIVIGVIIWFWHRVQLLARQPTLLESMLLALGITLSLLNLPLEYLTLFVEMPFMLLLGDMKQGIFYSMLLSFWLVFAGEHLMQQDDTERTGLRAYWKQLSAVGTGCLSMFIFDMCERGIQLRNPFYSIWASDVGTQIALSFVILAGVSAGIYFLFLSFIIYRVFRNISAKRQALPAMASNRRQFYEGVIYRFKFLMLATLLCAAMTVIGFILGQVSEGKWKWDEDINLEYTSAFFTGVYGMWNVYILALLCLYSPSHKRWPVETDGQEVTNEEIEFTPLPTEPSELSSLTAMIRKTATD